MGGAGGRKAFRGRQFAAIAQDRGRNDRDRQPVPATIGREDTMKALTRVVLPLAAAAFFATAPAAAQDKPTVVTVVKIAGIPWFNAVEQGIVKGGEEFGLDASMVGPNTVDPAQQVKLVEDLIARKVDTIGLIPLDVNVMEPVLQRAAAAGIPIVTHEAPEQKTKTWNIELIDSVEFGEVQMERLAQSMGGKGEYIVLVGTLTTPLHNVWADAAIAYQVKNYPEMKLVTDRFPGADEVDTAYRVAMDAMTAYPDLKGVIAFGSNGPIGAGNAVRERAMQEQVSVVGTCLPSPGRALIADEIVDECFLWNPIDAGYAMMAVTKLVLDGTAITDGMDIPGVGTVAVDADTHNIRANLILKINKDSVDSLIEQGL
jgi:simple sugar transport system substrate-binding protein